MDIRNNQVTPCVHVAKPSTKKGIQQKKQMQLMRERKNQELNLEKPKQKVNRNT